MICPQCGSEQADGKLECARCGIIFAKYRPRKLKPIGQVTVDESETETGVWPMIREILLKIESEVNVFYFAGRVMVFALIAVLGIKYVLAGWEGNHAGRVFLHNVNLPFHEAGHLLFGLFGRFITVLGGSLGQLLIPLVCMLTLLIKTRDPFGASVAFWWLGQNFLDLAPYIGDARALKLTLLGGITGQEAVDYHDWEFLLRTLGLLKWDHTLAWLSHGFGSLCILIALAWGGYLLYCQYGRIVR